MKTIEERVDKLAEKFYTLRYEGESTAYVKTKSFMRSALTELAADLNAEKEKEVAELRAWKESALLAELATTRARLAEVNEQCTELLDDLEQATVAHAQAESRLAELEEALETVEIRYAAFQLHTETTIRERDKRLAELEGITERLYEQQNYHHPNTCLGYVGKFMADYEAYKEGKK